MFAATALGVGPGAYPYVVSSISGSLAASASHTADLPSGIRAGDLLLFAENSNALTSSTPSGWSSIFSDLSDRLVYKVADGTETTVAFTLGASAAAVYVAYCIRNWSGSTADIAVASTKNVDTDAPQPPTLAPSFGAVPALWGIMVNLGGTTTLTAFPADYTLWQLNITDDRTIAVGFRKLASASHLPGAGTLSASAVDVDTVTFAIKGK